MSEAVQTRYRVTGMDCGACAAKVDAAVRRLPHVEDVSVSASAGTMTVRYDAEHDVLSAMRASLQGLGYGLAPVEHKPAHADRGQQPEHDDDAGAPHSHLHEDGTGDGP